MKPLSEYYKHKQMGDGLLGKCKACTVSDSKKTTELRTSTPEGLEKERARHRDKYHRLGYKEIHKPSPEKSYERTLRNRQRFPEKYKATSATANLFRNKGNHLHHWSYNEEHRKCVFELDIEGHNKLHRFIEYDKELFVYRKLDGTLLDTKEKHKALIEELEIRIYN